MNEFDLGFRAGIGHAVAYLNSRAIGLDEAAGRAENTQSRVLNEMAAREAREYARELERAGPVGASDE